MRYTQTFLVAALAASASAFSLTDIEAAREAETPAACFKALSADIDACSSMKVGGTCSSDCTAALKELSSKLAEDCSTAFGNPGSLIRRLQDGYPLTTAVCGAAKSDDADDEEEKEDEKEDDKEEEDDKTESATATSVKQQSTKLDLPEITRPAVSATGALVVDVGPTPTPSAKAEADEEKEDVKSMTLKDVTSTAASEAKSSSEASSSTEASSSSETASVTESGSATASESSTEATQAAATEEEEDADSAAGRVYIASGAMGMVAFVAAWLL